MSEEKNTEQTTKNNFKVPKIAWFTITWLFLAITGVWLKTNVTWNVEGAAIIATASISIMVNMIILGAVFATGIGQKILKRFRNRIVYHTGRYVNTLYFTKNGTGKEVFVKVDQETGVFIINKQKYTRNPKLLFNFEKIPTYAHREGNPDPLDIWDEDKTSQLSTAELDTVMTSSQNFDLKQWINQNKAIAIMAVIVIIGVCAASTFFGFSIFQMLRDGTYKAVECILPPNLITPGV